MPFTKQTPKEKVVPTAPEATHHRAEAGVQAVVAIPLAGLVIRLWLLKPYSSSGSRWRLLLYLVT